MSGLEILWPDIEPSYSELYEVRKIPLHSPLIISIFSPHHCTWKVGPISLPFITFIGESGPPFKIAPFPD